MADRETKKLSRWTDFVFCCWQLGDRRLHWQSRLPTLGQLGTCFDKFLGAMILICRFFKLVLLAGAVLSIHTSANAFEYNGFRSAMTLPDAEKAAAALGTKLTQMKAPLDSNFIVEGKSFSIFVCGGKVASLNTQHEGGIAEFALLINFRSIKFGEPKLQVVSLRPSMANIDANFDLPNGEKRYLQLHSYDGKVGISEHYVSSPSEISCE
ncbi:hypothetical protein [Phyllobacterium sp. SB3]|uniref:hypothetical protein n=1 Tax=Phyllobacterium sp. SB3 TaxID=3156073 RepID=UPI0032AEE7D7